MKVAINGIDITSTFFLFRYHNADQKIRQHFRSGKEYLLKAEGFSSAAIILSIKRLYVYDLVRRILTGTRWICADNSHYEKLDGTERCINDEIPFEIPENWVWARFGTAMINRDAERIPLSVNEREKLQKIYDYYGASGVIDKVDRYLFSKPLLLIGEDGANLLARSKPIAFIARGQYWVNNHAHVLDSSDGLLLEYVAVYINAINLTPYVTGTAQPKMNQEKMNSILIPIPPTGEQFRIVQKINQIFSVIANM